MIVKNVRRKLGLLACRACGQDDRLDAMALAHLAPYSRHYFPWSTMALRPSAIEMLLNELIVNKRRHVVECGIGISTLYLAQCLQEHGGTLVGIEEDAEWIQIVEAHLERLGVPRNIYRLVHAPLRSQDIAGDDCWWYDLGEIDNALNGAEIDLLVVDGPKSGKSGMGRYPAVPALKPWLAKDHVIFLDDIVREPERKVSQLWAERYDLNVRRSFFRGGVACLRPKGTAAMRSI